VRTNLKKRQFALRTFYSALGIPFVFSLLFLMAYPPMQNHEDEHISSLWPAHTVFVLAMLGWFGVLWAVLRGIRAGVGYGSGWAAVSLVPLLGYAYGLIFAWWTLQH
jgi:hypothetical protein